MDAGCVDSLKYVEAVVPDDDSEIKDRENNVKIVTREDWSTLPMPKRNTRFKFNHVLSAGDVSSLIRGHCPKEMEDKWFIYYEDGKVYFHRSWTGICIYIVKLNLKTNRHTVIVNCDKEQYSCSNKCSEVYMLKDLLICRFY